MKSGGPAPEAREELETLGRLAATFAARGAKPAIIAHRGEDAVTLTYAELDAAIRYITAALAACGVAPGDLVALWAPNSAEYIATFFAIVCTGAAVVPIDPQSGPDAAAALVERARPKLVVTTAAHIAEGGERLAAPALDIETLPAAAPGRPLGEPSAVPPADPLAVPPGVPHAAPPGVPRAAPPYRPPARPADEPPPRPPSERPGVPAVRSAPEALASLVFTSGTTGTPKGVPLTHRNLMSNATALRRARLIDASARVLLPLPLHHTYPLTVGVLQVLDCGATLILPAGISGPQIVGAAAASRATALLAVPRLCEALWQGVLGAVKSRGAAAEGTFHRLLRASVAVRRATGLSLGRTLFGAAHRRLGGALATIGCGGAKLDPELAWRLEGLGFTVLTGYGLTETSPVLTFNAPKHARIGSEGRALPGVEIAIAAETGQTSGEIRARGPNVFAGYWHDRAATEAAFADGWFRSGDLGFLDEAGYLHIVGRSKELIVLADGKKLFPEDLEKLYGASPLIREIAILEEQGALVALAVPDETAVRERGAVREADLLREALEDAAARVRPYERIVGYRVARAALPRTQLGKLKRHELPQLYREADAQHHAAAARELAAEDAALLARPRARAVWDWLSGRFVDTPLSLDTSPQIDLHVDSLGWVALTLEIQQRFGVSLTGEAVSRILTVRDLLREIEAAPETGGAGAATAPRYQPPGAAMRLVGALIFGVLKIAMRLAYRIEVEGVERLPAAGGFVITPNHASFLDPLALAAALPWRRLRDVYWAGWVGVMHTTPLRRFVSRATQVFPVDSDHDIAAAIDDAHTLLGAGHALVWFPEGRRSPTGEITRLRPGIGLLLQDTAAPAVPTALIGTFAAWPKGRTRPKLGGTLRVIFGDPLLEAPCADRAAGAERRRDALEAALRRLAADAQS